jgi:hypothetical protein
MSCQQYELGTLILVEQRRRRRRHSRNTDANLKKQESSA